MTEIDIDMAMVSLERALEDLSCAARDPEGRSYLQRNRGALVESLARLGRQLELGEQPFAPAAYARRRRMAA
jgi:hypothetical protein